MPGRQEFGGGLFPSTCPPREGKPRPAFRAPSFALLVLWICPGSLSQRQSPQSGLASSWPRASEHPALLHCDLLCRSAAPGWVLPTCSPDSPAQPLLPHAFALRRLCLWAPASPPTRHLGEGLSHAPRSSPGPSGFSWEQAEVASTHLFHSECHVRVGLVVAELQSLRINTQ